MEQDKKIRVAITHGDTNGVGYELILKAFEDPTMLELCTPIIYGSPKVAAYHCKALGIDTQFTIINDATEAKDGRINLLTCFGEEVKIEMGQRTEEATEAARKAIDRAAKDMQDNLFDVLVMAPTADFDGNGYLLKAIGAQQQCISLRTSEELRMVLVTNRLAIKEVPEAITKQRITEKAQLLHQCLRRDFRLSSPRIAVLALNPHVGHDEPLGEEEQEVIAPAIDELSQQGIQAFGPYPADELFGNTLYSRFDAVMAMYHDQGMTAFKSIATEEGVDLITGLNTVVTAPVYGSCHEDAGKNTAEPLPMLHAIYLAIDVCRNRADYDAPLGNPLPKLYHEKRDESEKVRFSTPRPKDQFRKEDKNE